MSSSLIENISTSTSNEVEDILGKAASKPRRSWKQFIHRRNGKRVYVCDADSCGKVFNYLSSLVKHERIHRGERPYTCNVCNQSFVQSSNLKRHQRIHTGEKTFGCTQCEKKFSTASNLRQHLQIHNAEICRKHYNCERCSRTYLYPSSLHKHSKVCDGKKISDPLVQDSQTSTIEPMLLKQVKIEEKIEEELTVNDQKSQPESPSINKNNSPLLQTLTTVFPQQSLPMIASYGLGYPPVQSVSNMQALQSSAQFLLAKDHLLKNLMQRTCFGSAQPQYLQNLAQVKQFGNPNLSMMGMNDLSVLLYHRQKALQQQTSLARELGRIPMF